LGPDPLLTGDLDTARRKLAKVERLQKTWLERADDADEDDADDEDSLWNMVKRKLAELKEEKRALQATIADIERRLERHQQTITQLNTLTDYCRRVGQNLEHFDFDKKRLALEALAIRVTVNGRNWQIEGRIPLDSAPDGVTFQHS
jgi:hypothetical protein